MGQDHPCVPISHTVILPVERNDSRNISRCNNPNDKRDGRAQAYACQYEAAALFKSSGH